MVHHQFHLEGLVTVTEVGDNILGCRIRGGNGKTYATQLRPDVVTFYRATKRGPRNTPYQLQMFPKVA